MSDIILALPFNTEFPWTAGWSEIMTAMQKFGGVRFDPSWYATDYPRDFQEPLLSVVQGINLLPFRPYLRSLTFNVGIAVPEEQFVLHHYVLNGKRYWDHLVAGSTWAANMLIDAGLPSVSVNINGMDRDIFSPGEPAPHDDFVIYSGGKFELRKSQDLVIQAVGRFMRKHKDVRLVCDWRNPWQASADTMLAAPLFRGRANVPRETIMQECGIDLARVTVVATVRPNEHQAHKIAQFRSCDVGLFLNRCEASVNSLLYELMVCGKAAIAMYAHGQMDIVDAQGALALAAAREVFISHEDTQPRAVWYEPDMEEVDAKLEWAYQHREQLPAIGAANRNRLSPYTLDWCGKRYVDVCAGRMDKMPGVNGGEGLPLREVANGVSRPKVARNEPCPCKSGKKFKKCCGA